MQKFFAKNLNKLVPGSSVDVEQQMLQQFIQKSKEMELWQTSDDTERVSVGNVYLKATADLDKIMRKNSHIRIRF